MAHFENHGTFTNIYNGTSYDNTVYGYDNSIYDINTTPQYIPSTGGPNNFLHIKIMALVCIGLMHQKVTRAIHY